MKKILFIGHAYHKKTKSSDFMQKIISEYFDVEFFVLDPYKTDIDTQLQALKKQKYDVLVLWQMMPEIDKLKKYIKFKHCAFFPMYDGAPPRDNPIWYQYRDVNIINFSETLHNELSRIGFSSFYFQFFPQPIEIKNWGDEKSIFFWQRVNDININTVEKLIDFNNINHIHFHHAIDPGHKFVEPSPDLDKKSTHSSWFDTREDMQNEMQKSAIYIAPRAFEGIGMSFLEAMAMGRCVIAPDNPTMNEYIKNGENGFLYNLDNPQIIDIKDIRNIQNRTQKYISDGFAKWEQEKWKIIDILTTKPIINKYAINNKYSKSYDFTYKLFGILPFMWIKGDEYKKHLYILGMPVLKIKGYKK